MRIELPILDGIASICIGLILATVAVILAAETKSLLIGEPALPEVAQTILAAAGREPMIRSVNGVTTTQLGPNEVIASLNVGGCNAGACHGTPSGKGGFKLSLRGYDPSADFVQLTRDVLGRRTDSLDPEASLVMQKALGKIPHEGGQRFKADSIPAHMMRTWLNEGLRDDPADLPWKQNQVRADRIKEGWTGGKPDTAAAAELLATLRKGTSDEACEQVVELLNREVSPQSVWDALFADAGELLLRQPGIVSLHAVTSTNALHYGFQASGDDRTRRLLMLQNAAFLTMFRAAMDGRAERRALCRDRLSA